MQWPRLELEPEKDQNMCFGCGKDNPIGLKLEFKWDAGQRIASARFVPERNLQGWGGYLHGGMAACVLDEAIGWATMYAGANSVTAKLQVRYCRMVPVNNPFIVSCRIARQNSRLIETEARITDPEGNIFVEATSTQYIVSQREGKTSNDQ